MKLVKISLLIFAIAGSLTSCLRGYESGPPKIILWHNEDAAVMPFIAGVMKQFEKENDGRVKMEQVHYETEIMHQQFLTAAVAGAGPDIIMTPGDMGGVFSIGKFIVPVENLINEKEFVKTAVDAIKDSGHMWGVPVSTGNHLMLFYNKKLAPGIPKTTDELVNMCGVIKSAHSDVFCLATNIDEPYFFIPWLTSFDGWPIDGMKPTLDTPQMREGLAFFKRMKDVEKILPKECDYNCMDGLFKEGKAAFIINGDWAIRGYREQLGNDFAIAVMPRNSKTGKPMRPMVGGKYLMINSNLKGDRLDWVLKFVHFYAGKKIQTEQYQKLGRLPGLAAAFKQSEKEVPPSIRALFDEIEIGLPAPIQVEMRAVWDAMRSQQRPFLSGLKDVETACRLMQEDAERKIKDMRIR